MVKAKFGALALTVLMGLGAVSPLHGVTEAHALNAPVANSAQQKTVVSTTDDSDGVMSYKDKESGKTFVSEDNGASWMSEEDYNNSHPAINYEWWTYDEYKEWLEQEKKNLGNACIYYKIEQPLTHRAEADALSAHLLYQKLRGLHGEDQPELFATMPLNCRMKRQQPATKRQKEYLQDLLKCHRINITVQLNDISRSDASRLIDKIILQYGRVKPQNK